MRKSVHTDLAKLMQNTKGKLIIYFKSGYVIKNVFFKGYIDGIISFIDDNHNETTFDISSIAGFKEEK